MADEGNESLMARMDLNLYLGLPCSPRLGSLADLGSDLALGSLPLRSSPTVESPPPGYMSAATGEAIDSDTLYSPTHASYDPDMPSYHPLAPAGENPAEEYTTDGQYEPYEPAAAPVLPAMDDLEGRTPTYYPMIVHALPAVQENLEPPSGQYDPASPSIAVDLASPGMGDQSILYSPTNPLFSPSPSIAVDLASPGMGDQSILYSPTHPLFSPPSSRAIDELDFPVYSSVPVTVDELLSRDDGPSSRQDLLRYPEYRFTRLIEASHRVHSRRFRSSLPNDSERPRPARGSSPVAAQLMNDIMSSQRELEGKHDSPTKRITAEGLDEETKEKIRNAANFECNICLDMAREPVVTSCGHLFCWPCLYQWLHLHCDHKECPVCKGEVIESNITPIYGRGSSESSNGKKLQENAESGLPIIPPRPRGNRFESVRQQYRPISRRLGDGFAASWRRLVDHRMRSRNMFEGLGEPPLHGLYEGYRTPLTRMRARRTQREEGIPESLPNNGEIALSADGATVPRGSNSNLLYRDGMDLWHRFSLHGLPSSDRAAAVAADAGRMVGRVGSPSNRYAASTSSVNAPASQPPSSRPPAPGASAADQASASSTMAVIQGDVAAADPSAEPNNVGSSRPYRRRGRSSTSGSLDVDGGALHARKRRRLN